MSMSAVRSDAAVLKPARQAFRHKLIGGLGGEKVPFSASAAEADSWAFSCSAARASVHQLSRAEAGHCAQYPPAQEELEEHV